MAKRGVKMDPDFNRELAGYAAESAVMARLAKAMEREARRDKKDANPPMPCKEVGLAVFESVVIYMTICPRQTAGIMRMDLGELLHDFQSAGTRKFLRAKLSRQDELGLKYLKSTCMVELCRTGVDQEIYAELEARKAMWEARLLEEAAKKPRAASKSKVGPRRL